MLAIDLPWSEALNSKLSINAALCRATTLISDIQAPKIESFDSTWRRTLWVKWVEYTKNAVDSLRENFLNEKFANLALNRELFP